MPFGPTPPSLPRPQSLATTHSIFYFYESVDFVLLILHISQTVQYLFFIWFVSLSVTASMLSPMADFFLHDSWLYSMYINIPHSLRLFPCLGYKWITPQWTWGGADTFSWSGFISLDVYLKGVLLVHRLVLTSNFWGTPILFSTVAVPAHTPTSSALRFSFLTSSPGLITCLFNNSLPNSCEILSHSSFLMISDV